MTTSTRMLVLLSLLQARRDWPGPVLAERLEISERTVRRDVDRLRELGYRITAVKGPDGGYRLDAGSELPPLLFDDEQAVAVAVALQTVAAPGFDEAALRALATVRQVMPARLRGRIDALAITSVPVDPGRDDKVDRDALARLGEATRDRRVVRFEYSATGSGAPRPEADPRDLQPPRTVEPHHLVARGSRWYLVAFDLDRDDWRIFRVDRIGLRDRVGHRFAERELPGGDVAAFVTGRFRGTDGSTGAWPCVGAVVFACPASELAPYVSADDVLEDLGEGRCRLVRGAWSWNALAARLAAADVEIEAVHPDELSAAFAALAARFARAADAGGSGRRSKGRRSSGRPPGGGGSVG